ncbi:Inner membrane protein ydgK [Salmonella enterica subsp. enterica]|uniref:Inner membrane protein ydgK n=1 Tax=Salmonella enterica I TaxID=59201 RepID=A0A379WW73_SALET|nr:Inner membrane protein ydgK [Salmonella enterica subsp. enterica]
MAVSLAVSRVVERLAGVITLRYGACHTANVQTLSGQETGNLLLWGISFITAIAMWYYTLWLTIAFFKRRRCVPKHYIIWLLVSVLLAVKAFAFRPSQMPLPCVSYSSHCWRRRSLCLISNVQRALKQRLLIRNNPTVNLLSPVVV